jgi:hypothetical protein
VVAERQGTSLPSYQMNPSRSAIDMGVSGKFSERSLF